MMKLTSLETYINKEQDHYGSFIIEPLEIGQGITLGNSLRRTLLSDLTGYAISGVRMNNIKHEFSMIEGLREDVLEVLLNLKEIVFKSSFCSKIKKNQTEVKGFLNVKGPTVVTAGMFHLPKDILTILNPNQYICTIVDTSEFYIEIDIEEGKGYKLTEESRKQKLEAQLYRENFPTTILIDSLYMPVKRVNYKVKLIHDSEGNIKESLFLEILTNGSITPKRSLQESIKLLMELFYSLFVNLNFLPISEKFKRLHSLKKK